MKALTILLACLPLYLVSTEEEGLINPSFIESHLTKKAYWSQLHGAYKDNLGTGMLYYGLIYAAKSKLCVCLGSGDGFVPRVMRQAQRDLHLSDSKTILVDGNMGKNGRPRWLKEDSYFRVAYPEIEIIIDSTKNVANNQAKTWQIDYLHIDADRTITGALQDFIDYLPYMNSDGTIILHDTGKGRACSITAEKIKELGYAIVNFDTFGTGTSIIKLN